jgi:hypothetical protein
MVRGETGQDLQGFCKYFYSVDILEPDTGEAGRNEMSLTGMEGMDIQTCIFQPGK